MRIILLFFVLLFVSIETYFGQVINNATKTPKRKCGTMEYMAQLESADPNISINRQMLEEFTQNWIANNPNYSSSSKAVITVPVVVHVVYKLAAENITDARVQEQINVLNTDYAGLNTHSLQAFAGTPSLKANTNLQFCLAQRKPDGTATNGIDRVSTTVTSFSTNDAVKKTAQGGADAWDPTKYVNIWVCNLGGGLCGYAQFPYAAQGGGVNSTFGVVIMYKYFGVTGAVAPYNLGGTTTHEIGHCFNLFHIWGDDGGACTGTDQCADVPNQANYTYGAHTGVLTDACSSSSPGIMYTNFMDYTDDISYANFTPNQTSRIQAVFAGGGPLNSLTTSNGCVPPGSSLPTVTTTAASGIGSTTATSGGNVTADGGATVTARGVCWATTANPVATGNHTTNGTGTGTFTSSLTGLTPGTLYHIRAYATNSAGTAYGSDLTFTTSTVAVPVANFTANNTLVCAGSTVQFTDQSSNTPTSWAWTFTGGTPSSSSLQNPSVVYNTAGTYTVTLIATNSAGSNTKTQTNYITVVNQTVAGFTTANTTVCTGTSVQFTDQSTNSPASWSWTFQGAVPSTSTAQNPTTAYSAPGTYRVTLIATNVCGSNTKTINNYITVINPVVTNFSANNTNICSGSSVQFSDLTTNTPSSWSWTFTGGTPSSSALQNPSVTYSALGTYSVTLIASNGCGPVTKTMTNYITVSVAPVASFSASPTSACVGNAVQFTDNSTASPTSWSWTFTGGAPSSSAQQNPSVTYSASGTYSATLIATNACGNNTKTISNIVVVNPLPVASFTATNTSSSTACDGSATANVTGGTAPFTYAWSATANQLFSPGQTGNITKNTTTNFTLNVTGLGNMNGTSVKLDNIKLSITHGSLSKLTKISLLAPDNTEVILSQGGLSGINLTNTAFSMSGANLITTGTAPYTGTYLPIGNFSSYNNNQSANGAWTLRFVNGNQNGCSVGSWSLTFTVSQTGQTAGSLCAGTYTVTVTNSAGCSGTGNVTIVQANNLASAISASTNVTCNGASTGSATVTATGGTGPYTYLWSNGATTASVSNLAAGVNTVTVTDAVLSTSVSSVTLTQPSAITVTPSSTNVNCYGGNNGTINLTVAGGVAPYTYLWSNSATTSNISGLAAGSYTVTVKDANNCTKTSVTTITQPASAIVASISTYTNVACNGGNNGSATVLASGGTPGYTYVWSAGGTLATRNNLSAGTYTVTTTDIKGCTDTAIAIISQPAAISISTTVTDASCGSSNGAATSVATGGTGSYTYTWSNGALTSSISNVAAGSYTVTVTDANNCTATKTVTINNISGPTANISNSNVSCNGASTGSASVAVTGGTAPYTYLWSSGAGTGSTASNLSAGVYFVTVSDNSNCNAVAQITITEPAAISGNITSTPVLCNGASTGSATIIATGGTSPYTYLWTGGFTSATVNNLAAGAVTVNITDVNGCTGSASVTITEPLILALAVSTTNATCGNSDGSATANATGGAGNYGYLWENSNTTNTINNLPEGSYGVTVTDANGCSSSQVAVVANTNGPSLSLAGTNVACNGGNDGIAYTNVSGGSIPYTFDWSSGGMNANETNLTAGVYSVTVTDMSGCTATSAITITEPTAIILNLTATNASCGNSDGIAAVTGTGGTGIYSYNWSNGGTVNSINNLSSGTYFVTVTDANGCTANSSIYIQDIGAAAISITSTNVDCFGDATGTATVVTTGGTAPFGYNWSAGGTGSAEINLQAGIHSVTVTDSNGCISSGEVVITEPSQILINTASSNISCYGFNNGSASVNVIGGIAPYTYFWSDGFTDANRNNLPAGVYTVIITDFNNCTGNASVTITEPALITLVSDITDEICSSSNGAISVSVSGGVAPYTYLWSNAETTSSIINLSADSYTLTVTDSNNCIFAKTFVVSSASTLTSSINSNNTSCFGTCDGAAIIMVSNGTAPYAYTWDYDGHHSQFATNLCSGNYTVSVVDASGCIIVENINIGSPAALFATSTVVNESATGAGNGSITLVVTGGTAPYSYQWSANAGAQTGSAASNLSAGVYTVTITDFNNCSIIITETVDVNVSVTSINSGTYSISPNPTVGHLTIDVKGLTIFKIEISDIFGRVIINSEKFDNTAMFDLSEFKSGMYFVKVYTNNTRYVHKILVK
ncbi:MAG: PKD domain-containing protein [Bacteroidia bacterium]|nr:PKD domain-containing protein [Bacteroidia bacterium]